MQDITNTVHLNTEQTKALQKNPFNVNKYSPTKKHGQCPNLLLNIPNV